MKLIVNSLRVSFFVIQLTMKLLIDTILMDSKKDMTVVFVENQVRQICIANPFVLLAISCLAGSRR